MGQALSQAGRVTSEQKQHVENALQELGLPDDKVREFQPFLGHLYKSHLRKVSDFKGLSSSKPLEDAGLKGVPGLTQRIMAHTGYTAPDALIEVLGEIKRRCRS